MEETWLKAPNSLYEMKEDGFSLLGTSTTRGSTLSGLTLLGGRMGQSNTGPSTPNESKESTGRTK